MNTLYVKAKHKGLWRTKVERFNTTIDCSSITLFSQNDQIEMIIKTRKQESAAIALFFDVFSLLFIYLGAYPVIDSIVFNDSVIDTSQWVGKYITRSDLFRHDLIIADISSQTINQASIDEYRKKQITAIYSLQYLASMNYVHVISDHRITLLFHIIDGICELDKGETDTLLSDMIQKYKLSESKAQLGHYLPKVYAISNECFFYYHRKYNCGILKLLRINQYTFLKMITDTRNWNSHFLRNKKPNRLKKGTEIVIFFELVQYMIRLKIAKDIGVIINEENVKEYYYTIHDWILKVVYDRDDGLKSKTYISGKQWDEFIKQMNQLVNDTRVATSSTSEA